MSKIVLRAYIFGVNLVKIGLVVVLLDKASDIHRDVQTFKLVTKTIVLRSGGPKMDNSN